MENNYNDIFSRDYDVGPETRIGAKKQNLENSESQTGPKYEIGPETKSEEREPILGEKLSRLEFRVDTKKYGIGKPRRVILRGKLSHD